MKKSIAKLVSIILIAVLVFTVAACGKKETQSAGTEPAADESAKEEPAAEEPAKEEKAAEEDITGTYMGQLDFSEQTSKKVSETLGFEVEEPLYMDVYLELNEDNSFRLYVDSEKYKSLRKESKMVQTKKQHCAFR